MGIRLLSAVLLALLLAGADAAKNTTAMSAAAKRKAKDELLAAKLKVVEAAQKNRTDIKGVKNMTSDIVEELPEAELWNADADVSTVGACEEDIERFCRKVEPGEGRLAGCLTEQLEDEEEGDARGRTVSDDCRDELAAFKMDRATNVNKDIPLAKACRDDIKKHCLEHTSQAARASPNHAEEVLDCLRHVRKKKLSDKCAKRVFEEEEEEAKDWRVDPALHRACAKDVEALCDHVDAKFEGAVTQCLIENLELITSTFCQDELQRVEEERAEDVRLDRNLYHACSADMRLFCDGEEYGDGQMQECLEEHREDDGFSERCRTALEARMELESNDYELNYGLREYCADDIERLCKKEKETIHLSEGFAADAQVITCLETKRTKVHDERCKHEVHRQMEREAEDIRFDHELAKACHGDVKQHCGNVVRGSARVVGCLEDNRAKLTTDCSAKLFEHETMLAEDIDFKYPLQRACVTEISIFCREVPHGHARVVRCLQDYFDDVEMSVECRDEVKRDQLQASHDYRLNYRLHKACSAEMETLCSAEIKRCSKPGVRCQGAVTECLRDKMDSIRGEECRNEVFHVLKSQVSDYRLDPELAAACGGDVAKLCADEEPGEGRVHVCLHKHWDKLSAKCREQESKLSILQARDVRLRPSLQAACSEELAVFCKDVEPGKARLYRCLVDSMGRGGFGEGCRQEVLEQAAASQKDYRLDYGVGAACQADVDAKCKDAKKQVGEGKGVVLKCLISKYKTLAEGCQGELSRSVRSALWAYKEGSPLTAVCDKDVEARCPALPRTGKVGFVRVGAVGECLSKQAAQEGPDPLSPGCKQLVLVAAPRDARAVFDSSMSLEAATAKVAQMAHSVGLSSTFVNPKARGMGAITVTGWVAFLSVCALVTVVLSMLGFGLWRYLGSPGSSGSRQHRYTRVVKEGDV